MTSINDFLRIRDRVKEKWGQQFYKDVDFCGLEPVINWGHGYNSTPKNSATFATTGGDGVHFGLVTDYNNLRCQPIVMTVPMMPQNMIVAENLDEFLGIGFYNGWFALEQLVYNFDRTVEYYSTPDDTISSRELNFLELLKEELKIKFTPLTKNRLEELRTSYYGTLDI